MYRNFERNGVRGKEWLSAPDGSSGKVGIAEVELMQRYYPPLPHKEACNNECDVWIYVASGLIDITINKQCEVLSAGEVTFIPKGAWYRIERIELNAVPFTKLVHTSLPPYSSQQHVFR
jgi:mannose-6-phosphate isomerase-like protein (cupin superfamily)